MYIYNDYITNTRIDLLNYIYIKFICKKTNLKFLRNMLSKKNIFKYVFKISPKFDKIIFPMLKSSSTMANFDNNSFNEMIRIFLLNRYCMIAGSQELTLKEKISLLKEVGDNQISNIMITILLNWFPKH